MCRFVAAPSTEKGEGWTLTEVFISDSQIEKGLKPETEGIGGTLKQLGLMHELRNRIATA